MMIDQTMIYIGVLAFGGLAIIAFGALTLFKPSAKRVRVEKKQTKAPSETKNKSIKLPSFKLPKLNNPFSKLRIPKRNSPAQPKKVKPGAGNTNAPNKVEQAAAVQKDSILVAAEQETAVTTPAVENVLISAAIELQETASILEQENISVAATAPGTPDANYPPNVAEQTQVAEMSAAPPPPPPHPVAEPPKPEKTGGGAFTDMFSSEMHEETEASKFAKKLAEVDINSLLETSRNLQNNLTKRRS